MEHILPIVTIIHKLLRTNCNLPSYADTDVIQTSPFTCNTFCSIISESAVVHSGFL